MKEKVNLLHTVKKEDLKFMKRIGTKEDAIRDEPIVYKSRLEE